MPLQAKQLIERVSATVPSAVLGHFIVGENSSGHCNHERRKEEADQCGVIESSKTRMQHRRSPRHRIHPNYRKGPRTSRAIPGSGGGLEPLCLSVGLGQSFVKTLLAARWVGWLSLRYGLWRFVELTLEVS